MKYILTIGLLFLMKLSFGQAQSITKLDETKVLISEIDKSEIFDGGCKC
ncbi:MAG: hypothetical protein IPG18_08620 [Saprospiraceae bacterium]|nr:hypothetical protein [Saprospiraceae bacterium]